MLNFYVYIWYTITNQRHASYTRFNPGLHQAFLQEKLASISYFWESEATQAVQWQKTSYDLRSIMQVFNVCDFVGLSIRKVGKSDPKWEGKWSLSRVVNLMILEITDGVRTKVVHVNHLQHLVQKKTWK